MPGGTKEQTAVAEREIIVGEHHPLIGYVLLAVGNEPRGLEGVHVVPVGPFATRRQENGIGKARRHASPRSEQWTQVLGVEMIEGDDVDVAGHDADLGQMLLDLSERAGQEFVRNEFAVTIDELLEVR